ncbi:MAG TPA: hypothetical protein VFX15_02705 [Actinomycetes bacterium]|nr:hypothetical protein [Actinomycetes bacterium]
MSRDVVTAGRWRRGGWHYLDCWAAYANDPFGSCICRGRPKQPDGKPERDRIAALLHHPDCLMWGERRHGRHPFSECAIRDVIYSDADRLIAAGLAFLASSEPREDADPRDHLISDERDAYNRGYLAGVENEAKRHASPEPREDALRTALNGLVKAVIAMKHAIPAATTLGDQWRPFLAKTGDVNAWLDAAEAALAQQADS